MRRTLVFFLLCFKFAFTQTILIPMDLSQTDHLKAYGIAYMTLKRGARVEWLLNYRGGSFMTGYDEVIVSECRRRGVVFETIESSQANQIYRTIENSNMDVIVLEKAPSIAVYTPPNKQPWDDAVTLALTYAEIPYQTLWDEEVLRGELVRYDWLHLHHEDFTGQYGKFYSTYHNSAWYINQQRYFEAEARRLGFRKVSELKAEVARKIKRYISSGGFLFAMCSATDTYDIALAAEGTDICDVVFDGDPVDPDYLKKIDYTKCLAFENFKIYTDPYVYEFSNIDITPKERVSVDKLVNGYFLLFEFSAKYDPVPAMLTQNHVSVIHEFMGQTTGFNKKYIKRSVVIMAENRMYNEAKYIHGNFGKGTFTFLGGHDPEDYRHFVGDPPTNLALHKNSPGYRLILNNILFVLGNL